MLIELKSPEISSPIHNCHIIICAGSFVIIITLLESHTKYSVAKCKMLRRRMQNASSQNAKCFVTECKILRHRMQNTSSQNGTASATMTTHHIIVQVATMDKPPPWTSCHPGRAAALDKLPPWTSSRHGLTITMDELSP